ncbi:MAG: hypothetical protein IID40_02605 [Planctomycetes bacterium]|nr:hypothetical protein [Planctomycetota bacterium]
MDQHILKYGVDVFPPLNVRDETTRANDLFRELNTSWPEVFQELSFRPDTNEFQILSSFQMREGTAKMATVTLTPRGPAFAFPLRFGPLGMYEHKTEPEEVFLGSLAVIQEKFPGVQVLRVGLIRELVFSTGRTLSAPYLAHRYGTFPGAESRGGNTTISFRDDRCNIRVKIDTVEVRKQARLPATRQVMEEKLEYGLAVNFDVNNVEMTPQSISDIHRTLERANSLWPKDLLDFLNWRKATR